MTLFFFFCLFPPLFFFFFFVFFFFFFPFCEGLPWSRSCESAGYTFFILFYFSVCPDSFFFRSDPPSAVSLYRFETAWRVLPAHFFLLFLVCLLKEEIHGRFSSQPVPFLDDFIQGSCLCLHPPRTIQIFFFFPVHKPFPPFTVPLSCSDSYFLDTIRLHLPFLSEARVPSCPASDQTPGLPFHLCSTLSFLFSWAFPPQSFPPLKLNRISSPPVPNPTTPPSPLSASFRSPCFNQPPALRPFKKCLEV